MRISPITNGYSSFPKKIKKSDKNLSTNCSANTDTENCIKKECRVSQPAFKSIFVDRYVDLGRECLEKGKSSFLPKDYLLLNEIANQYPYQDCFIMRGYGNYPRLEYREKPPQVQIFKTSLGNTYNFSIDPKDKEYPVVSLLIHDNDVLSRIIGMPSNFSSNPSLPYTVKAGYELHKKLMDRYFKILKEIGNTDQGSFSIGPKSVIDRAREEIEEYEIAVQRYLLECAYNVLSNRPDSRQIYSSNIPKVQSRLDLKRTYDLETSRAQQVPFSENDKEDICKTAIERFPNVEENKRRIENLKNYMSEHGLMLG